MEMEWNAKWDWENLAAFGSKAIDSPKNLQVVDWTIVDDGEIHGGSFNLCAGGNSGASGSEGKSSMTASADSSCKDAGMQTSIFKLSTTSEGSCGRKLEMNGIASPTPEASVGSAEALLGLKLGRPTYFENSGVKRTSLSPSLKKTRSSTQNAPICCQVEGCSVDLSLAKEYHRKHRVCDAHSKCPKVIVGGCDRRFCQQCSRFHSLCEFDEKKRSCRRRLSDHNARRRKPQQETIQFNPPRLATPFYGGGQQMNYLLNKSRFRVTSDEQLLRMPQSMIFNTEYGRALSLLSTNSSWVPHSIQAIPLSHQGVPFPSSSDFCPPYHADFYSNVFNS